MCGSEPTRTTLRLCDRVDECRVPCAPPHDYQNGIRYPSVQQEDVDGARRTRLLAPLPRPGRDTGCLPARAGRRRRRGAHAVFRGEPWHGEPRLPRRRAPKPAHRDAGAVPGRRVPRAGQVRLPQCRPRRGRAAPPRRTHGLLPLSAPEPVRRPGECRDPRTGHRARRAGGAGRDRGDRGERPVGRRADGRRPDRRRGSRHDRLLRGRSCRPVSRRPRPADRFRPCPSRRGRGAGRRLRPPRGRTGRLRPRRPRQRHRGRTGSLTGAPRPGGNGAGAELVRRPPDQRAAGEAFHSGRLVLRGSQVGRVSEARRSRRTFADRLALSLELLADPAFDALVTGECAFEELPSVMSRIAAGELPGLCHRVVYDTAAPPASA